MQVLTPDLYQYRSATKYLVDYVVCQQQNNYRFSIRGWARDMGMSTHTLLVMMLQGKRKVGVKQLPFLAKGLNLTPRAQLYLQALIQIENASNPAEKELAERYLAEHSPVVKSKETDQFWMISDWIHMAILEIAGLQDFKGTCADIKRRLRTKFTTQEIQSAVQRLKSFRLLEEREGKLVRIAEGITTKNDVPSSAAREYNKQIFELAKVAIEEQSVDEREFQSFAISAAKSKLPIAKKMIREFRAQLCEVLKSAPQDEVYQITIGLFGLTNGEQKK